MARRVVIKGGSGAGKTTLARDLAHTLGVPCVELDALHHGPRWVPASAAELTARVQAALADPRGWVVDGNYDAKLQDLVLDRADLIVWLDLPLSTKLRRLLARSVRRWLSRQELWNGNRETLSGWFCGADSLFPYAVRSHFRQAREWPARFDGRHLVRLRTPQEVQAWRARFGGG
jgi:adenylate kinase family enzyme